MSFRRVAKGTKIVETYDPVALNLWGREVVKLADEYQAEVNKLSRRAETEGGRAEWRNELRLRFLRTEAQRLGIV